MSSEQWTNALQAFTYDVVEEGPDQVVAGTLMAGANTILLQVSANEIAPGPTPHNPHRSVNWGECFFPPTVARYPKGLVPSTSDAPQSDAGAAFGPLRAIAEPAGVLVVPWMQILRTPEGADDRNRTVNVRGEIVGEWLCPNGPETLDYAAALTADCVERFQASALFIDKIRFPSLGSGAPRSIDDAMACFCDGCFDRAKREGVDLEGARRVFIDWLGLLENEPAAVAQIAADLASSAIRGVSAATDRPEILNLLRFRHRTITRLVERVRASIPQTAELWLDTWSPTEGWLLGQDLRELAEHATWVKPFFYHQIATWSIPGVIRSISSDARIQQVLYESYLKFLGYVGPSDFETFSEKGLLAGSITTEMARAKTMLAGHAKLGAGVGLWDCGPEGVREALARAAAAEPNGVWMLCYSWATMDELAAAGDWLREHGKVAPPRV
jgi:hypothetical protein